MDAAQEFIINYYHTNLKVIGHKESEKMIANCIM